MNHIRYSSESEYEKLENLLPSQKWSGNTIDKIPIKGNKFRIPSFMIGSKRQHNVANL